MHRLLIAAPIGRANGLNWAEAEWRLYGSAYHLSEPHSGQCVHVDNQRQKPI